MIINLIFTTRNFPSMQNVRKKLINIDNWQIEQREEKEYGSEKDLIWKNLKIQRVFKI